MAKFVRVPIEVEAHQWLADNNESILESLTWLINNDAPFVYDHDRNHLLYLNGVQVNHEDYMTIQKPELDAIVWTPYSFNLTFMIIDEDKISDVPTIK